MFINLVNKDEDLAKYLNDSNCLKGKTNFINLGINIGKSPSLKQIELCRPISGIKKLIQTQTIRKESPDSTICDRDSKDNFNESMNFSNNNALNTNNKKYFKNESKFEDFLSLQTPQKKSKESPLLNFHSNKIENLFQINEKIEVIAEEENNEFLLTGIKFKSEMKPKVESSSYNFETEYDKLVSNKKAKDNHLPPLLKKTSSILTQSIRNNFLFGKNATHNDLNSSDGKFIFLKYFI